MERLNDFFAIVPRLTVALVTLVRLQPEAVCVIEIALTISMLAQVLTVATYRYAFHPLRKYPGPFIAAFTDAYGGFHALKRQVHLITYQNHQKYGVQCISLFSTLPVQQDSYWRLSLTHMILGSVVRQAPNRLAFNSVEAVRGESRSP